MNRVATAWLTFFGILGLVLVLLYPDSYQQDSGFHYLQARWAWTHAWLFVNVWGRPLYTVLYAVPALLGYPAAKLLTVAICVATAWQTWRLAEAEKLERPELAIPLLLLQPCMLLILSDTLTEPICGLVFVIAMRLHRSGRIAAGAGVASLMALTSPWGFILAFIWGVWVLVDGWRGTSWIVWLTKPLLLLSGMGLWWLAALIITHDPLWIRHDWPSQWKNEGHTGVLWWYAWQMATEIIGGILLLPFLAGLVIAVQRKFWMALSLAGGLFVVISLMFRFGLYNCAGYARYFVCVAPAVALITLAGWNRLAALLPGRVRFATAAAVFAATLAAGLVYVDGWPYGRDAVAVQEMWDWYRTQPPRRVEKLAWSQAYMCICFGTDPGERIFFTGDPDENRKMLRDSPPGTMVFWDAETGPAWYRLKDDDLAGAGYERLRSRAYDLPGYLPWSRGRKQTMHLFYKP